MLGRRSSSAVVDKSLADSGSRAVERAAETVTELAERALVVAREAQRAASPALRSAAHTSAETLSHAAEKAAVVLADAADRLSHEVAEMPMTARERRAAEKAARKAERPKRWGRRIRRTVVVAGVAGGVYLIITKTPLRARLSELVFGPPLEDEEPEPITLPVTGGTSESAEGPEASGEAEEAKPARSHRGKGTAGQPANQDNGASA
jgi:hypothetical protein